MIKEDALLLFSLTADESLDVIIETYENAVFEEVTFFMRRVFVPQLAHARIEKLKLIQEAAFRIGVKDSMDENRLAFDFGHKSAPEEILSYYNRQETSIKLRLSNASHASEGICQYQNWIRLFDEYARCFLSQVKGDKDCLAFVKLTEAPIFSLFSSADSSTRKNLIDQELARLKKMYKNR